MLDPISIDIAGLNFTSLVPMIIIIMGALAVIIIDLVTKDLSKSFYVMVSELFILLALGSVVGYSGGERGFFDVMLIDGIATLGQIVILVASALFIPLALSSSRFHEYSFPEFFALFLFMVAGFQFMVASDNLIMIFVGLETASLALYTLIAMHNRSRSFEAAVKYFTMGALAAGFFVFGAMILYALTGSVEIHKIEEVLVVREFQPIWGVLLAVVFMIAALGFKLSMVPFQTWVPDVYEGASAALAGYMSIVPKIAGFVVAMRIFEFLVHADIVWLQNILWIVAVVTMTATNIMALVQEGVKRMLAYSSISHAGFAMSAILIGTTQSNSALFLYWILFTFTNLGAFTMLWVSRHKGKQTWSETRFDHPYEKFSGMVKVMPINAVIMGMFMFSLAGVPPFSLFWGKLYLMSSAVNAGFITLAIIMAINSAISVYYYLKLVVYMFLREPKIEDGTVYMKNASTALKTIIGFAAAMTLLATIFVNPILEMITSYVKASGF
jgi:NADH-quinone oxidoreductase subunit N